MQLHLAGNGLWMWVLPSLFKVDNGNEKREICLQDVNILGSFWYVDEWQTKAIFTINPKATCAAGLPSSFHHTVHALGGRAAFLFSSHSACLER